MRRTLTAPPPDMSRFLLLLFLAIVARFLVGCGPAWGPALSAAAPVAQGIACAVCGATVPAPPPAVEKTPAQLTVPDLLAILEWAAELKRNADKAQEEAAKELAARADKP
jgi:hypothetical protein